MQRKIRRQLWNMAAIAACTLAVGTYARGESGELFPNVKPYDETVSSPITKPENVTQKPAQSPAVQPPAPEPAVVQNPPPEEPPAPVPGRRKPPKRRPGRNPAGAPPTTTTAPAPPPPLIELAPYSVGLMTPMLTPAEQGAFNAQYGGALTKALAGSVELRRLTADAFETAAATAPSAAFKRYLLLDAFAMYIRASTPLAERVQKAQALLPLLTDRTLPVVQARADALNDLMLTASSAPSEHFLDLYIESYATLAKLQVQTGFPRDAQASLKKAREGSLHDMHKSQARKDQINEAAAWCERSSVAAGLWPKFQATLKTSPDDVFTNTLMATLHLSLYGHLSAAAVYAARSGRKDLKDFAAVIQANPPEALSKDPVRHVDQVLAIAAALVNVAKATSVTQTFDRYSIACYAGDHVDAMLAEKVVPLAKLAQATAILDEARGIVERTNLRRGDDLPEWLDAGGTKSTAKGAGKGQPAARKMGSLADIFRGLPRDLAPSELGWTNKQARSTDAWLLKNVVGQTFQGDGIAEDMQNPVEGNDGKVYVPAIFSLPQADLTPTVRMQTQIELRMTAQLAERAKDLVRGQRTVLRGKIISVHVQSFGAGRAYMVMVIDNRD